MAAPFSTVAQILTDLEGVTYSASDHTVDRQFQILPEDFVDFEKYPVYVVIDGSEEDNPQANKISEVIFHPEIHFFAEDETPENMAAWRDSARDAIMSNATLLSHSNLVSINAITPFQSEDRKLNKLVFFLTIEFHMNHGD